MISRKVNRFVLFASVLVLLVPAIAGSGELNNRSTTENSTIILTKSLTFHLDVSEYEISKSDGYDHIASEGLQRFTQPGEPLLPMQTFVSEFSKSAEILEISITDERRVQIQGTFDIMPTPQPLTWDAIDFGDLKKDSEVYALDEWFPGEVFSYRIGEDNHKKYVYTHVYPVQYIPSSGRVSIVTDLVLQIRYQYPSSGDPMADDLTAECIIIAPPELYPEAIQLSDFHESSLGVPSSVVNTTWIYANYSEAPDPPFIGYWDFNRPGWNTITGYDYSLAKRTMSYLRNQSAHPNMKYVLLYGNAELVPPSFYWYDSFVGGFSPYEGWIPTDFFYSSPDYDLTPNYAVGRLPVDGSERATNLNQKIDNWYSNLSASWFNNAAIAGGRPFDTAFYVGELINQDAINRGYLDGFEITKMHQTDWRFDRIRLLEALSGEYGIVYEIGHGMGDRILLNESGEDEAITALEVMNLPSNSNVSVFVSIACDNGAFDNTVMANRPFLYPLSFGESVLFSPAGAIAYVGGARSNSGMPVGTLDGGVVNVTDEVYMAHILTSFWRAFHEGAGALGDISMSATAYFTASQNMNDVQNQRALFEYVLLGDPVLPMTHPQEDRYKVPTTQILDVNGYESYGNPMYLGGFIPIVPLGRLNSVHVGTDSPSVGFKIIDAQFDSTLEYGSNTTLNNETYYAFTPSRTSLLLLRAEGEDGKEGWHYMRSKFVPYYPKAPALLLAELNGPNDEDVVVGWYKSTDEGLVSGTVKYEVFRSVSIIGPYSKVGDITATGAPNYVFVDSDRGDGDPNNYFYYVQSVNSSGKAAKSYYAGKYVALLTKGWHLISLPLTQHDRRTDVVFRTLDYESVVGYVSYDAADPWKRYDSFKSYGGDLKLVDHTMGLWVDVASTDSLTIAGLVPKSSQIVLNPGWNLVGYPTFIEKPVETELEWIEYDRIEGFDPASEPYHLLYVSPSDLMSTGSGYWIKMSSEQTWIARNPA